ncbi:sodium channel protein Nach [Stomoxys calcitrans]|uniref:Sodium channel protein Nach n=1 Tax=Stomoxys calcitrans TaxID=35570 RepID=A0A1I8P9D3_STOCA|nr:sodium channel protein Nach [Stomoxys calcitrans]
MKTFPPLAGQNQQPGQAWLKQPQTPIKKQKQMQETDVALVMGRAAWWKPALATTNAVAGATPHSKNGQKLTFNEALKDFLQNFSFHCYGKLVETGRGYQEKLFWLAFHVVALSALIIFLLNYHGTGDSLLTTSIYDPSYAISRVPFPAVSVCPINRISNESAKSYARELKSKDPRNRSVEHFYEQIKFLYYNHNVRGDMPDYEKALKFQRFLDIFDRKEDELFYNTRRRMTMLTPSCQNILKRCRLAGKDIDCAKEFTETYTSKGLCCTFNHDEKYSKERSTHNRLFGPDMGLLILLNASHGDDFFPSTIVDSYEILIHSPRIQPNPSSGSVEERIIQNGTDTYISIKPKIFQTIREVSHLKPRVRNCLYHDEIPDQFGTAYTFSNCISHCRARSIVVLCQCLPFMMTSLNLSSSVAYCSLEHRECLMRYDFKWYNVITERRNVPGLEREMEDSLYCPDCLPTCTEVQYSATLMDLPLNEYNMKSFPPTKKNLSDLAIVHVYFGVTNAVYYQRFLMNSWFETFSYIGNICGIIAGFSLIGIGEVVFFVLQQMYRAFRNELMAEQGKNGNKKVKTEKPLMILP